MNYYILPKNTFNLQIRANYHNKIEPYISNSLNFFLQKKQNQLTNIELSIDEINNAKQAVNYLSNVYSSCNNYNINISKLSNTNQIYYELLEVISLCGIKDILINKQSLTSAFISPNSASINNLFTSFRNNVVTDINYSCAFEYNLINNIFFSNNLSNSLDILFFEFKEYDYYDIRKLSKNLIIMLYFICKLINKCGTVIFKLDNCFHKIVIDFIYIISSLFDKTIILKPFISNITDNTKYLICKGFNTNTINLNKIMYGLEEYVYTYLNNINNGSNIISGVYIDSILDNKIPYYFINKLEEINIVIGQQQIDSIEQVICLLKNKNKDEKLEIIKKGNIIKAIQWCEKFNVPHIKQIEKPNIFLKRGEKEVNENNNV